MIFGSTSRAVLERRKTQTRRIPGTPRQAKRRDWRRRGISATYITRPWVPQIGATEPVQPGRGKHAIGHIHITAVRQEPVGHISLPDARAEGCRTTDEFRVLWVRLHDRAWVRRHAAWVTRRGDTALGDLLDIPEIAAQLVARFHARHTNTIVWVIEFRLARSATDDTPRFMAAGTGHVDADGNADYTASASRSIDPDAEAVDAHTQARLTKAARKLAAEQRESFRRDLEEERERRKRERRPPPWEQAA